MSLTLTRMRALVRQGLGGLDSTDLPDLDTDELLNLALWELEAKYEFEQKETQYTATLTNTQYEYPLPSGAFLFESIISISIIDSQNASKRLERMTRSWLDENFDTDDIGMPEKYLRENLILTLFPIPGADEDGLTIQLTAKKNLASLLEGTQDSSGLPRNWDELVVEGAIARGHFFRQDYNKARQARDFQVGLVRSTVPTVAMEEQDARYAGLDVAWDNPNDSSGSQDDGNPRTAP